MTDVAIEPARCRSCGTELAPSLVACPSCGTPTRPAAAAAPPSATDATSTDAPARPSLARSGAVVGGAALFLWKFKLIIPFLLTKGKLLILSIPKMGSMLVGLGASLGVYWIAWGWQFAVGVIACLYVHELGHVVAMRMHGIPSSAPMFVPGLGAYVRMARMPKDEVEHARIGLAGPIAGLIAALACAALFLETGNALFAVLAKFGAVLNLVNMIPLWHLDGARAFGAFGRRDRWFAIGALAAGALVASQPATGALGGSNLVPLGVAAVSLIRVGEADPPKRDAGSVWTFALVSLALSALLTLPAPHITPR